MKRFRKRKDPAHSGVPIKNGKLFDAPPSDSTIQEIPRSLREFIKLQESVKNADFHNVKPKLRSNNSPTPKRFQKSKIAQIPVRKVEDVNISKEQLSREIKLQNETPVTARLNKLKQKKKLKLMKLREKRKQKKLLLKLEKDEDIGDVVKDDIKFGEVVHRPPQLSVLPRKVAQSGFQNRPGRKDDLLLKSLLRRKHIT